MDIQVFIDLTRDYVLHVNVEIIDLTGDAEEEVEVEVNEGRQRPRQRREPREPRERQQPQDEMEIKNPNQRSGRNGCVRGRLEPGRTLHITIPSLTLNVTENKRL